MIAFGSMTMPCWFPSARVAVETPELVIVKLDDLAEVVFTRAEFSRIEAAARAAGKSVERWIVDAALEEARSPSIKASPRGLA